MDFDDEDFEYSKLDMVRLFINAGRMDGLKESNIVKGIASRSSLSGRMIGSIELHKNFAFVDIPREHVEEVMEAMKGFTHAGRGVSFEVASKKKRGGSKGAKKSKIKRRRMAESSSTAAPVPQKAEHQTTDSRLMAEKRKSHQAVHSSEGRLHAASAEEDRTQRHINI